MEPHRGPQGPARGGDRAVRGERIQQTVKGPVEIRAGGEGGDPGGFRHQLSAGGGGERRECDEQLRGCGVGEAVVALQEPHLV